MARERYLVGVSKEELQRKPEEPRAPMTLWEKWDNLWYHHKALILFCLFLLATAVFVTVQTVTQVRPDYRICMGAMTHTPDEVVTKMEEALEAHGLDLNGDGKVVVEIQSLNVSAEQTMSNTPASTGRQSVMAHIVARDVAVFAFAPEYYAVIEGMMEEGSTFFLPINGDDTYVSWNILDFSNTVWDGISPEIEALIPADMYVGVRNMGADLSEKEQTMVTEGLALLKRYFEAE